MEPTIIAAFIGAGAKLVTTFYEDWNKKKAGPKEQKSIENWVEKEYDTLYRMISEDSVLIIRAVESGKRKRAETLKKILYPKLSPKKGNISIFNEEFKYRLSFLCIVGVITRSMHGSYGITRLGISFLAAARQRTDYTNALK